MVINYPNFVSHDAQSERGKYQIISTNPITFSTTYLLRYKAKKFE